jgi:hypothetical protein
MELKRIRENAIPTCLDKARHYRLLNEPQDAASICLDILDLKPDHQEAIKTLILALTDQFDGGTRRIREARQYLEQLTDEYDRTYHAGLILERAARAALRREIPDSCFAAYDWLQEARIQFEKAEALSSDENDDAVLRWNACTRAIARNNLKPRPSDHYMQPYGDS